MEKDRYPIDPVDLEREKSPLLSIPLRYKEASVEENPALVIEEYVGSIPWQLAYKGRAKKKDHRRKETEEDFEETDESADLSNLEPENLSELEYCRVFKTRIKAGTVISEDLYILDAELRALANGNSYAHSVFNAIYTEFSEYYKVPKVAVRPDSYKEVLTFLDQQSAQPSSPISSPRQEMVDTIRNLEQWPDTITSPSEERARMIEALKESLRLQDEQDVEQLAKKFDLFEPYELDPNTDIDPNELFMKYMKQFKHLKGLPHTIVARRKFIRDEAADRLLMYTNAEQVMKYVKSLYIRIDPKHMTKEDMLQEGFMVIKMTALPKYNPTSGYKFNTYLGNWVNQRIRRAINDQDRTMRLPNHVNEEISAILNIIAEIRKAGGKINPHQLTQENLSEILTRYQARRRDSMSKEKIVANMQQLWTSQMLSLNQPSSPENKEEAEHFIPDKAFNFTHNIEQQALAEELDDVLSLLNEDERKVLKLQFGLEDGYVYTLIEIANLMNPITYNQVRKLQYTAFRKLRQQKDPYIQKKIEDLRKWLQ
jgi:RNA polymerase primary sigma factor